MNNLTKEIDETFCRYNRISIIIDYYTIPSISVVGILTNLFNSIVFYKIIGNIKVNGQMFKYLLLKSLNDLVVFFIYILKLFYYCKECDKTRSYATIVCYIVFYNYLNFVGLLFSGFLEMCAAIDCYLTISKKLTFLNSRLFSNILIASMLAFSSIFYIYSIFNYEIKENSNGHFHYKKSEFYHSSIGSAFRYAHVLLRDVIIFMVLIVVNMLILVEIKKSTHRKKKLTESFETNLNAICAEKKKQIMIAMLSLNYICGHIGMVLFYMPYKGARFNWSCFYYYAQIPFFISYITNAISYYAFNKNFKKFSHELIEYVYKRSSSIR